MIEELETVVLTSDIPEYGLKAGDIGAVVLVHDSGRSYEVEFVTLRGDTVAVITVKPDQVRLIQEGEIAHARMVNV
ncbi:MAG: DUF4926 domain-containing protein [Anaerolineae bacterium]|nr:DUF4926 domain-containing protein [Anaerolineae bacterium]